MNRIMVVIVVVAMLAISASPALAAQGPSSNQQANAGNCTGNQSGLGIGSQTRYGTRMAGFGVRTPYALSGTIVAVDQQAETVTVTVTCGNRLLSPYLGTNVILQTITGTRFLLRAADGTITPITLADLVVGESISSHGSFVNSTFIASRLTQGAELNCIQ